MLTFWSRSWTSRATERRSRPLTFASTCMRREVFSRNTTLGVGCICTFARSPSRTRWSSRPSSRRLPTLSMLLRVSGVLQTCTSMFFPSRQMSPASSLAMKAPGAPPHVSGLDAVPRRGGEIHLDPDLWDFELEIGVQVDDAVDPGHQRLHLLGLLPQDTQVVTVDTHHDGLAGAGEDLFDALPEVGLDIAIQSRVAVDGLLDGRTGLVVVGRLVDADPVLGEVDAVGLVGQGALPDVGTEVADPGDGAQLLAGLRHDAVHLRVRGAQPAHPVHQEVALLEVRKEFLAEPWPHHEAGQHHDTDGGVRGGRRADDPGENRLVSTLKPPYDRGLALPQ